MLSLAAKAVLSANFFLVSLRGGMDKCSLGRVGFARVGALQSGAFSPFSAGFGFTRATASISLTGRRHYTSEKAREPILTLSTLNERVLKTEYAVRGELVIRAMHHKHALEDPTKRAALPFDEVVLCNIGNPQELQQKPVTFIRQVLSLLEYPELMNKPETQTLFPGDVIKRAKEILRHVPGGLGAYSSSMGIEMVRKNVEKFIEQRDGYPATYEDIFLTDGASAGAAKILEVLIRDSNDAVLVPIPQYPLYSATIPLLGGTQLNYYLDEDSNWGLQISELETVVREAKNQGINPRAMVVINPGNPTGQCLDLVNMKEVIDFCHRERLVLLADEVYQVNSYSKPWVSFKKALRDMGPRYNDFEMLSFHSVSKGVIGECGHRGGYMEAVGIDEDVKAQIYKIASISLCSNIAGQVVVDLMVNPPKKGDESYPLYEKETTAIFDSLKYRSEVLMKALNQMEGVTCNPAEGAMYLFPRIRLPPRAIEEAKRLGKHPDVFYSIGLLDATGICVVPGSGFGQKPDTLHFRTTFLPPVSKIEGIAKKMADFHKAFMQKWA